MAPGKVYGGSKFQKLASNKICFPLNFENYFVNSVNLFLILFYNVVLQCCFTMLFYNVVLQCLQRENNVHK